MIQTSEWVSLGHPDKVADYISCYLLDRHLERDPDTRFAVEVQIKGNFVSVAGEITSKAVFSHAEIALMVRAAVRQIGYTKEYQDEWGKENTICADDLAVAVHITQQSPDIAQGVDADGWGDQGIFWGMAVHSSRTEWMPRDWWLASRIGHAAFNCPDCGLDVKTQVTLEDRAIRRVIVAAPCKSAERQTAVESVVRQIIPKSAELIVNGTGRYVVHGPIADCGTTGRKLAVDFYGGNCRIGGGSPWTKDGSKADVAINLYARYLALEVVRNRGVHLAYCSISCCIGRPEIHVCILDGDHRLVEESDRRVPPSELADLLRLREPRYAAMCRNGLFAWMPPVP